MILSKSALRFVVVGIIATVIHMMAAAGLIEVAQVHPTVANGAAYILANLASYIANTQWSFNARMDFVTWRRFVAVSLAAWMLTMAIASAVQMAGGHYMVGIALVVTIVPMLTFMAHRTYTYR